MGLLRVDASEISKCERSILDAGEAGKRKVPKSVRRVLKGMRGYEALRDQMNAAMSQGQPDEAVRLLRSHPRWKRYVSPMTLLVVVVSISSACLGTVLILDAVMLTETAEASRRWPRVRGTILKSSVERHESTRRPRKDSVGPRRRVRYTANIEFRYLIDGVERIGANVTFAGASKTANEGTKAVVEYANAEAAQQVVERYPVGADVQVSYDPDRPELSVLEPGGGSGEGSMMWGVALLALAVAFPIVVLRSIAA